MKTIIVPCTICAQPVKAVPYKQKRNKNFFCSRACNGQWRKETFTGKSRPKWVVEKVKAASPRGDKHWWWKGGISSIAYRLRRSVEFKKWREFVFKRDNYTCVKCKRRGFEIHPNHVIPFSELLSQIQHLYPGNIYEAAKASPMLWDTLNGETLCKPCHLKTDSYGRNLPSI